MVNSYYQAIFRSAIDKIKLEERYRIFSEIKSYSASFPKVFHSRFNKEITLWCSNDYLGMSKHPIVIKALTKSASEVGIGSGGTRNISGNSSAIVELETVISDLHDKESALVFTSGYIANHATLSIIGKIIPDCVVFSDQFNHASIIHGVKESKLEKCIFKHNDINDLREKMRQYPKNRPKLIVVEAVYLMTGDIAPLVEICDIAKEYNALTYLDEVHSVGLYGKEGAGIANLMNVSEKIDIIQGTLAKSYGVIGGYIAATKEIVDTIRSYSPGFIFTTSLPPPIAEAANASIAYLRSSEKERENLFFVVSELKKRLSMEGIDFVQNETHIVPIMIWNALKCRQVSEALLNDFGIYIQCINFPTVPVGYERLRITPTPFHNKLMIEELCFALKKVFEKLDVEYKKNSKIAI